jgi:hypothetical protein
LLQKAARAERGHPRGGQVKTTKERQEERRQEKLDDVQRQIRSGSLVVRQMTAAERARNPPRPPKPKRA